MRVRKARESCPVCDAIITNLRSSYCSNTCQMEQQYRDYIARWKAGTEHGNKGKKQVGVSSHVKRFIREKYLDKCSSCGWAERNPHNGIVHLTIDHRDGNWANTAEDNLVLLCPNCHTLTPTYGALNRGKGRSFRHLGP